MTKPVDTSTTRRSKRQLGIAPETSQQDEQDTTVHNAAEEGFTQEETTQPSNGAAESHEANTGKRKKRGPTKMCGVAKHHDDKVDVEFTLLGEPVGKGSVTLSSFLGPLVRELVPVLLDDWRHLDDQTKSRLWEAIQGRFNLTEGWQKDSVFRQMGCLWRASKSRLVSQVRNISKTQLHRLKPSNIQSVAAWKTWVKSRTSAEFKVQSDRYRELRKAQIPHTTSRKGMIRLAHEMRNKSSEPSKVTRSKVWVAGHTHSDGRPVRPEFAETFEQIKSIDSEMASTAGNDIKDDAVSRVLGKDKSGRLRGMGRGVTATKLAMLQARDAHVEKLEAQQAELINKINDLQNEVRGLAKGKKPDDVSVSEASNASKVVTRCQILDWCSNHDIVVGEGEFCSVEPMYKIGRIPIGPNAAAVIVNSVSKEDAFLWRPTQTIASLGQAVGTKISWPWDKIILDNDMNSPTDNHTAGSSATIERVIIFAWNMEDVIAAEGLLISTDPKEMANNIPLGPNAAIVKVEKVVNKDAYLWRPIGDLFLMNDALHELIAWPIDKIGIDQPPVRASPKESSPTSASCSMVNNKSNEQKKCKLLDLNDSGEIVAEGRVCSTNPEDKVHFVPLGPDASKVWVEVLKIGGARVWRPNSEIEFIGDALGTTVTWPNDKLEFM